MQQLGLAGLPITKLTGAYDLPDELVRGPHSRAFADFLKYWFADTWAVSRGEYDIAPVSKLTSEEKQVAKLLIRRNLATRHVHIIECAAALEDLEALPTLRAMFDDEPSESRRLTIAESLWRLDRDPVFVACLEKLVTNPDPILKQAHHHQILWLKDERAIDFLIRLLDDADDFVRFRSLTSLNEIEFGERFLVPSHEQPSQPDSYRSRKDDPAFRAHMVAQLRTLNFFG